MLKEGSWSKFSDMLVVINCSAYEAEALGPLSEFVFLVPKTKNETTIKWNRIAFKKIQPKVEVLIFSTFERHASSGALNCFHLA